MSHEATEQASAKDDLNASETEESFTPATTGDAATSEDKLGFKPYARGLTEFLLNPETKGPLTVSVEGKWGSGKSSFLLILEKLLTQRSKDKRDAGIKHNVPVFARFNPWRYDKDEELWAAFAVALTKQLANEQEFWAGLKGRLRLVKSRFEWKRGWLEVLKAFGLAFVTVTLVIIFGILAVQHGPKWVIEFAKTVSASDTEKSRKSGNADGHEATSPTSKPATQKPNEPQHAGDNPWFAWLSGFGPAGVFAADLIALIIIISKLKGFFTMPLAANLRKHMKSPDYASRVSFIEEFHEDFRRVVEAYANGRTVFVFVDDLDRCAVPRAADLMQAINLMISTDLKDIVFILAMDREKIAAGLAVKNADLLPYLYLDSPRTADGKFLLPEVGLQFGFEYIEKFIQVSFPLPRPRAQDIETFLESLKPGTEPAASGIANGPHSVQTSASQTSGSPTNSIATESATQSFAVSFSTDSKGVREVASELSPFLDGNPRRLKQFINLFRLRAFVAYETGALGPGKLTAQQLGKLIAIQMLWPIWSAKSLSNDVFWAKLRSDSNKDRTTYDILQIAELVPKNKPGANDWKLLDVDIDLFSRVSPSVRTINLDVPNRMDTLSPVKLPVPETMSNRSNEEDSGISSHSEPSFSRILWVSDNRSNIGHVAQQAESRFHVSSIFCGSGEAALDMAISTDFQLIVWNMTSDSRTSYVLLDGLRKQNIQTPFLIFSVETSPQERAAAVKRGAIECTDDAATVLRVIGTLAEHIKGADSAPPSPRAVSAKA